MTVDFLVIGGITEDIMFSVHDAQIIKQKGEQGKKTLMSFPVGAKLLSNEDVLYTGGGGGANSAISLAKLGLKTALISSLGVDLTAVLAQKRLLKNHVNTKLIQHCAQSYSGLSFIVLGKNKNDHVIFTHRAANDKLHLVLSRYVGIKASWIYLSSLSGEHWKDNLQTVFNLAAKKRIKVAWNPGSVQLKSGFRLVKNYLQKTELLILNKDEAAALIKNSGKKAGSMEKNLETLSYFGPKIIAITNGDKGAWASYENKVIFEPAIKIKAINSTGAGDAFGSSLAGGLHLFNGDLNKSLKLALIRSGEVVSKNGAQKGLITLSEVEAKYQL